MTEPARNSYDEVPYLEQIHPQTHPDRLATVATVLGLDPPEVATCRVLELGCGSGGNLLGIAMGLPGGRFVGVDLSAVQVAQGRRMVDGLGLANVDLRHADLREIDASWGTFDYILCHGVWSWVPAPVREKVFAICQRNLAPDGVAYVSYNVLPGWRLRGVVRDFMRFHGEPIAEPRAKVRESLAMLDFLAQNTLDDGAYKKLLGDEWKLVGDAPESYLYHEMFEADNDPVYFRDFAAAAARHGLGYLGEAQLATTMPRNFPAPVADVLRRHDDDPIRREQYIDFFLNRRFRETLLVHAACAPRREFDAGALSRLRVASRARPTAIAPVLAQGVPETFRTDDRGAVTTANALTKAALRLVLERWPRGMPFDALVAAARERCAAEQVPSAFTGDDAVRATAEDLLGCHATGLVELHAWMPPYGMHPTARPQASPLARLQAGDGAVVTNLRLERIELEELPRRLLELLDGRRDRAEAVAALAARVRAGAFALRSAKTGATPEGEALLRALGQAYDHWVPWFARAALLVV